MRWGVQVQQAHKCLYSAVYLWTLEMNSNSKLLPKLFWPQSVLWLRESMTNYPDSMLRFQSYFSNSCAAACGSPHICQCSLRLGSNELLCLWCDRLVGSVSFRATKEPRGWSAPGYRVIHGICDSGWQSRGSSFSAEEVCVQEASPSCCGCRSGMAAAQQSRAL